MLSHPWKLTALCCCIMLSLRAPASWQHWIDTSLAHDTAPAVRASDCLYLTFSPDIDWNIPRDTTQKEKTGKISMSILNEVVLTAHVLSNLHNLHNRWDDTVTAVCCHGPGNSERWGIIGLFGNWMYAVIWGKAYQSGKRLSWELQWETWSE